MILTFLKRSLLPVHLDKWVHLVFRRTAQAKLLLLDYPELQQRRTSIFESIALLQVS